MKPVLLPQPSESCFTKPNTPPAEGKAAAIAQWRNDVRQVTRQWLRNGGSLAKWFEDYRRLRLHILSKNWALTIPPEFRNQVTYILLGASARGEDTLTSDLDYALLLSPQTRSTAVDMQPYLYQFGRAMSGFGVEPCPGNVMGTNPRWIGSRSQWNERIDSYFQYPSWENTRYLFMMVDSLPLSFAGDGNRQKNDDGPWAHTEQIVSRSQSNDAAVHESWTAKEWNKLRSGVACRISQSPYLCWEMAHAGIDNPVALGERLSGFLSAGSLSSRTKSINVKTKLINPIVHSVRLLSMSNNITALSTLDRLNKLSENQVLDRILIQNIKESLYCGWEMRLYNSLEDPSYDDPLNEIRLAKMSSGNQEKLLTHLQTARKLVRIVHRRYRKPR